MRKYLWLLDILLLATCAALLLVDLQIKNDLVARAKDLEGKIDDKGRLEGDAVFHSPVSWGVPDGNVFLDPSVEVPASSANGSRPAKPRKRNPPANRGGGDSDPGIHGSGDEVGS